MRLEAVAERWRFAGWYKELVAMRVSILCESAYAIRAHSISAQKKGASAAQIDAVGNFESGPYRRP